MNDQEFRELLDHLRRRLRDEGHGDLDERIIEEVRLDDDPEEGESSSQRAAQAQLLDYLRALETEMRLRSRTTVERTIDGIADLVAGQPHAARGGPRRIERIELELIGRDRTLFGGEDRIDLGDAPDLSGLAERVGQLGRELSESGDWQRG